MARVPFLRLNVASAGFCGLPVQRLRRSGKGGALKAKVYIVMGVLAVAYGILAESSLLVGSTQVYMVDVAKSPAFWALVGAVVSSILSCLFMIRLRLEYGYFTFNLWGEAFPVALFSVVGLIWAAPSGLEFHKRISSCIVESIRSGFGPNALVLMASVSLAVYWCGLFLIARACRASRWR